MWWNLRFFNRRFTIKAPDKDVETDYSMFSTTNTYYLESSNTRFLLLIRVPVIHSMWRLGFSSSLFIHVSSHTTICSLHGSYYNMFSTNLSYNCSPVVSPINLSWIGLFSSNNIYLRLMWFTTVHTCIEESNYIYLFLISNSDFLEVALNSEACPSIPHPL